MECAKCGEYFIGTCVSLKCYDILYNEKKELEQENAKLKAKLMNIEEGLKRLDDKMAYGDYAIHSETGDHVCLYNGFLERSELSAPTLSGLIDKILTGGE